VGSQSSHREEPDEHYRSTIHFPLHFPAPVWNKSCALFGWLEKRLMLMLIYYERKTLLFY
jgi:hypothetical protein